MHADLVAKTEPMLSSASVADLRFRALKERCALTVEATIIDIVCADADDGERAQAILDIAIVRNDLPHIQSRSCRDLAIIDPSRARELVRHLLKEPPSDERDIVRARAFTTLAELPNLTEQEVLAVAHGLKDRLPLVREQVARAIKLLPSVRLRELQAVLERLSDNKGAHVVALRELAARVVPGVEESAEPEVKTRVRIDASGLKDSERHPTPKLPKQRTRAGKAVHAPVVQRISSTTVSGKQKLHNSSAHVASSVTHAADRPVSASNPPPADVNLSALSVPPRTEVLPCSKSIESLRSEEFAGMTWADLRVQTERLSTPRALCACIAEMVIRFGKDATLEVAAGQLCFVVSHTDPEIKAMSASLSTYLFSS